jgi:hypothetical protein
MLFAIAALLIQPAIAPKISLSADNVSVTRPVDAAASSVVSANEDLPTAPVPVGEAAQPSTDSAASASTSDPAPINAPSAITLPKPVKNTTVSVRELQAEDRRNRRIWLGLSIASHSAAEFDAWSTRNAITTKGGYEVNPLLKPFAGNASIYAAIQVEPTVMDYVARKMMYSRHGWERHTWWVPQTASFLGSIFCGAHNVGLHSPSN